MKETGVTVVIPTLNRGRYLIDTITDLLAQDHRPLEILVVDQSDSDDAGLQALAAQHADTISHHHVVFRGLPIARNYGWQMARYDLIVYVDDDIRCSPTFISHHSAAHAIRDSGLWRQNPGIQGSRDR